jgi:hypothetical protein
MCRIGQQHFAWARVAQAGGMDDKLLRFDSLRPFRVTALLLDERLVQTVRVAPFLLRFTCFRR